MGLSRFVALGQALPVQFLDRTTEEHIELVRASCSRWMAGF